MKQEMMWWQWHQLDHMQIICTSHQTDNYPSSKRATFTTKSGGDMIAGLCMACRAAAQGPQGREQGWILGEGQQGLAEGTAGPLHIT